MMGGKSRKMKSLKALSKQKGKWRKMRAGEGKWYQGLSNVVNSAYTTQFRV